MYLRVWIKPIRRSLLRSSVHHREEVAQGARCYLISIRQLFVLNGVSLLPHVVAILLIVEESAFSVQCRPHMTIHHLLTWFE